MIVHPLASLPYRAAWALQEEAHARVVAGGEEEVLLVEHAPVITFGRRAGVPQNVVASAEELGRRGVEVVQSDRGGDVTFHGPGQLVAYPIVRLIDHRLSVGAYVQRLEDVAIATLADLGIVAHKDVAAIGVWVGEGAAARKICALGVRIRRGVSMHGIALNVTTDLSFFDLIVPCGLRDREVTSVGRELPDGGVTVADAGRVLVRRLVATFGPDGGHESGGLG